MILIIPVSCKLKKKDYDKLLKIVKNRGDTLYNFVQNLILSEIEKSENTSKRVSQKISQEKTSIVQEKKVVDQKANTLEKSRDTHLDNSEFKSVIELEQEEKKSKSVSHEQIKKMLESKSWTGITLEKWIEGQLKRLKFIPANESFKKLFPQLSDDGIENVIIYYQMQGFSQRLEETENITRNGLSEEA